MSVESEQRASGHRAEVVELQMRKHDGADTLSVAKVHGYECVLKTEDWAGRTRAVFVPPDTLADVSRPEFAFLARDARADGKARIKAKKIRGVLSFGLLVPASEDAAVGDDCWERLGLEHYEPTPPGVSRKAGLYLGGEVAKAPSVYFVRYDIEAGRRYASQMFEPGEPVFVTEKIHGASMRLVFHDGVMHVGSRGEWKKEFPDYDHVTVESVAEKVGRERAEEIVAKLKGGTKKRNAFWQAFRNAPVLESFCVANPGLILHGECYGSVQDLRYGHAPGQVSFAGFDMMLDGKWMDSLTQLRLAKEWGLPWVPLLELEAVPYDFDRICAMAEGKTTLAGASHVREGCVVKPVRDREHPRLGRACLKWVGCGYLERKEAAVAAEEVAAEE